MKTKNNNKIHVEIKTNDNRKIRVEMKTQNKHLNLYNKLYTLFRCGVIKDWQQLVVLIK